MATPLTRREFNRRVAGGVLAATLVPDALWGQQEERPVLCRATLVNGQRLWRSLEDLGRFGRLPEGGTTRIGFSDEDLAAHNWLLGLARAEGLQVSVDAAGNLHARRPGERDDLPAIWFGSHIDTVPRGGNFDGCVGSMSALEVMRTLNEKNVRTRHPLEMVIFRNEEGHHYARGLFGSRAVAGLVEPGELILVDERGVRLTEWIRRYGGSPELIPVMKPSPGSIHAFLELHIEQGGILWNRGIPIGIVEGIVGINEYDVVLEGAANHAGTTPMDQRRDALVTASKIVLAVREIVTSVEGRQVGTVGMINVKPGARNIVPGRVELSVELRDLDMDKIDDLGEDIRERAARIAAADKVGFSMQKIISYEPALTHRDVRFHIQKAVEEMRAPTLTMASGAGHDAQDMARICPVGMIFVPSRDGISHAPEEYTRPDEVACGCEALYRTILRIDRVGRFG